jgi:hypothetical protein
MSSSLLINLSSQPNVLRARGLACWWVLWLALSLLLSQSLGQLHAIKHGGLIAAAHTTGKYGAQERQENQHHAGFLDLLFSSHGTPADCRLYDQLSDGQAMPLLLAAPLPMVSPSLLVAIFAGDALARWVALFDARGPPLTR